MMPYDYHDMNRISRAERLASREEIRQARLAAASSADRPAHAAGDGPAVRQLGRRLARALRSAATWRPLAARP